MRQADIVLGAFYCYSKQAYHSSKWYRPLAIVDICGYDGNGRLMGAENGELLIGYPKKDGAWAELLRPDDYVPIPGERPYRKMVAYQEWTFNLNISTMETDGRVYTHNPKSFWEFPALAEDGTVITSEFDMSVWSLGKYSSRQQSKFQRAARVGKEWAACEKVKMAVDGALAGLDIADHCEIDYDLATTSLTLTFIPSESDLERLGVADLDRSEAIAKGEKIIGEGYFK